ncbi:MAG: BMP family protein [Beijerinckiaceae bacterium]|nr:BMP family protein [Beijerinckiaceae bacterium]
MLAGKIDDGGFMEAGYRGLVAAREKGASIAWIDGVKPERPLLEEALRKLAAAQPAMIIAHGGQNNEAAKTVAAEFPDIAFVVTQGNVTGPNLASYEVLQEESAFLAGMLAALTTRTGIVGHMSGIRVTPGLKGRAGYANGVAHAAPQVKLLTNFSGNQDDSALSKRVALAMADAGADIIFTMLNAGRMGAVDACREKKIAQIGNVFDWIPRAPDVFVASAIADSGLAVLAAAEDRMSGAFKPGMIRKIGLAVPAAVRLSMADSVPPAVRERIEDAARDIASGKLVVSTDWNGPEFANPPTP